MLSQLRRNRHRAAPGEADFVDLAHRSVFGSPASPLSRRRYDTAVERGAGRLAVLEMMLRDPRHQKRVLSRFDGSPGLSDEEFVDAAYRALLGRDPDPDGRRVHLDRLARGESRADLYRGILRSDEYVQAALAPYFPLADLRRLDPARFRTVEHLDGAPADVYWAEAPGDFDWIEAAILDGGYYDRPGVWSFELNTDKRLMAEIVASLGRPTALELGCSNGGVLSELDRLGVRGEGIEISAAAIAAAPPSIRDRIHAVNATAFELPSRFGVVFGLDIFEHLNPNRLDDCLARIAAHLDDGGFVFCNIPAFGEDSVFGTAFHVYLKPWREDCDAGRPFRALHTDHLGYPLNGHLIWAHTDWWVARFEAAGLRREPGIERALHGHYDAYMERESPARRSFYVFSRNTSTEECGQLAAAIGARPSAVLAGREA